MTPGRNLWNEFKRKAWVKIPIITLGFYILFLLITPLPKPLFSNDYATVLEDKDGHLLSATLSTDQQWRFPPMDTVPYKIRIATRLFEDEYFYLHPGVNPVSIVRAARQNIKAGKIVSGGSTITMQTIRLALKNPHRNVFQKLYEMHLAIKLDLLNSKKKIFALYTSHAPYGGNIVGLQAASWRYYGRPPDLLSWAEAASLAVLPNNPGAIFPGRQSEEYLRKRNFLIDKLYEKDYITSSEAKLAKEEDLPGKPRELPRYASHLLSRAIKEGYKGKTISSTIDRTLQLQTIERVNRYSKRMQANGINNAAAIIIEIKTGNTLAYIGNIDDDGSDNGQFVDIITSRRSTGSLLKPLLYAAAMDEGICLPKELLPDIPLFYEGFAPKNFDKRFRGAVQADKALTSSLNVPFVYMLREYGCTLWINQPAITDYH
jgi:penicillin-binding protein 1C